MSRSHDRSRVVYSGSRAEHFLGSKIDDFEMHLVGDLENLRSYLDTLTIFTAPDVIMMEVEAENPVLSMVHYIKDNLLTAGIIIILLSEKKDPALRKKAIEAKVHDLYFSPFNPADLEERLDFLVRFRLIRPNLANLNNAKVVPYRIPTLKRVFDIVASVGILLMLSPLMLIIAILIKLDSKGPLIYKSKRVGTGYRIFDFYKFRSMKVGADAQLKELAALNQYADKAEGGAFFKLKDDPRVTKLGNFIRKTSIDELPQLFNVLKGDMSLVGNRPLPLYEAEMLTSNEWSMRFLGPSGLTGLWQISKRGKADMSETERKKLDNFYARNYSILFDLKILLGTIPALFQKEKV
ncbi:sugar transferase [Pedobacter yulinensis]|uniref:Sugar transferase n=1 Tax=Pedobacter yulinensis TaxID=2126353 RepID=A0A2T3HM26_9SPHI|nr:sugar transferase [Pedobacter yulinensis]PST83490.1 sugar transferase [Pedobacter yulinensis]